MSIISLLAQTPDYYSDPAYTDQVYTTAVDPGAATGAILIGLALALIAYVVGSFLLSRIFKKAGVEPWKAWVPVYNNWVLLELGGQQGFWVILMFVPVVNFVALIFYIIAMYNIGLKLGKSGAFVLLAIFLPLVWLIWLAFDSSKWQGATAIHQPTTPPAPTPPTIQ